MFPSTFRNYYRSGKSFLVNFHNTKRKSKEYRAKLTNIILRTKETSVLVHVQTKIFRSFTNYRFECPTLPPKAVKEVFRDRTLISS